MKKILFAIATVSLIAGCATQENIQRVQAPIQVIHTPPLNVESEVEIGQTIVSKSNLAVYPAILLSQDVSEFVQQSALNNRWSGTTLINAGKYRKTSENPEGSFYPDPNGKFKFSGGTIDCLCGIFVPKDSAKSPVIFTYHKTVGATGFEFGKQPVATTAATVEIWGKDSLKKELIYGGLSQKTIAISYREFSDGTARPAFTQELKYDLSEGDVIGFRGARFNVIKASNTSIKYKMLKPLD